MSEIVYSVKNVFNKALFDNGCCKYYIAPYQRGYKWSAARLSDQVPQMLVDIYNAYKKQSEEYYLQYITIKRVEHNGEHCLELIDGQQRLTTLSIIFHQLGKKGFDNYAKDRMLYFRYEEANYNCFDLQNIDDKEVNEHQDLWYMSESAKSLEAFFDLFEPQELEEYVRYLSERVKIIFNLEDELTSSEEVFENLNCNRVPLSNHHLIKGLLLTKAVVNKNTQGRFFSYKEILDQRTIMGRIWDEITAWIMVPEVSHFFFSNGKKESPNGIEELLRLVLKHNTQDVSDADQGVSYPLLKEFGNIFNGKTISFSDSMYELFNDFNRLIVSNEKAISVLNDLKHAYRVLYNVWYGDNVLFNMLGYMKFTERKGHKAYLIDLIWGNKADVKSRLAKEIIGLIPDMSDANVQKDDYKCLSYENKRNSTNDVLTRLLLSFSTFTKDNLKFDFYKYDKENWTLEHLSPQNPKDSIVIPQNIKEYVIERLSEKTISEDVKTQTINKINAGETVEIDLLDFLYDQEIDIHNVGNMALLGGPDNSSVSNYPFIIKRSIIINRRNEGSFVPYHTILVYEKSLNMQIANASFSPDLMCWSKADVEAHKKWMACENKRIREFLKTM